MAGSTERAFGSPTNRVASVLTLTEAVITRSTRGICPLRGAIAQRHRGIVPLQRDGCLERPDQCPRSDGLPAAEALASTTTPQRARGKGFPHCERWCCTVNGVSPPRAAATPQWAAGTFPVETGRPFPFHGEPGVQRPLAARKQRARVATHRGSPACPRPGREEAGRPNRRETSSLYSLHTLPKGTLKKKIPWSEPKSRAISR